MDGIEKAIEDSSGYIYTLSYRLTGTHDDARDLMQETFLRAFQKWGQVKDADNPLPWLRKICVNIFIDAARSRKKKTAVVETDFPSEKHEIVHDDHTPELAVVIDEEARIIQSQCFTILSTALCRYQRIAFVLIDVFRMDIAEVSRITGKSVPATKSLLFRARTKMNRFLVNSCGLVSGENVCSCSAWKKFSHDVERKRNMLKTLLGGAASEGVIDGGSRNALAILYRTLPYLKPPE